MQLLFLYNFFTEQINASKHLKIVNLYDHKFNFLQVYSTFHFNYRLLFEEGLTLVCLSLWVLKQINRKITLVFLSLQVLKQINRKIATELAIARKKSFKKARRILITQIETVCENLIPQLMGQTTKISKNVRSRDQFKKYETETRPLRDQDRDRQRKRPRPRP